MSLVLVGKYPVPFSWNCSISCRQPTAYASDGGVVLKTFPQLLFVNFGYDLARDCLINDLWSSLFGGDLDCCERDVTVESPPIASTFSCWIRRLTSLRPAEGCDSESPNTSSMS